MFNSDDPMGQNIFGIAFLGNFCLTLAIMFFGNLSWSLSISIILGMAFLLSVVGYIVHLLVCEIEPLNSGFIITNESKRSTMRPTIEEQGLGMGPTYSGFTDGRIPAIYLMLLAPAVNILMSLKLIHYFHIH